MKARPLASFARSFKRSSKKLSPQEAQVRLYELACELEMDQWHIIDDLRTRAPDDEKALAREIADLMEAELRKGSGNG
jgi:hypothetical protein